MTVSRVICMYCKVVMGTKDGQGKEGDSHGICRKCWEERFDAPYPEDEGE